MIDFRDGEDRRAGACRDGGDVPRCNGGPLDRWRFVARELVDAWHSHRRHRTRDAIRDRWRDGEEPY